MKKIICRCLMVMMFSMQIIACTNSDVALVKSGVMSAYNKNTVGNVFEASFDEAQWQAVTTKKGERVVRFTGKISQDLHDAVVADVEQKTQTLKVYQQEELKIQYIQQLVKKQGIDGALFQQLNAEYGCVLRESSLAGGVIWWTPTCQDNANWGQYLEAAKQAFLAQAWQVGDTVEVEWTISADGKQFDVTQMASPSWEGLAYEHILAAIYR